MKITLVAALCLATVAPGFAVADDPEPQTPPETTEILPISEECLLSLAGFGDEFSCSLEEIDSIRARISSGTF